ncbi:zinc-binding alcohol dehydrogenase family protein [Phycicoccus sp. BSK3Z-2]|uniref:Zinc-binding alcohol dehydrogenase family protein n=2 Tax=Phycicoccus avicenniae TaxID=2828860 RepID=A0A941HYH1_9MICO|nr:zinc-binding alcohol dehydrogenase family protein [Phycicoccus avicenniae]
MSDPSNEALWATYRSARLSTGQAAYTRPGRGEIVVRVRAVALNPVDTMTGWNRRVVYPWLNYPAVLGVDVAGDVVEVGPGTGRLSVGERVIGLALGQERDCNSPAHGAFQKYVVLRAALVSPIPDQLPYEQAAVLPLGVATAASGLFGRDQLALDLPDTSRRREDATVLVWGGSTSVGCNAIQLARHAGYRVVTTASPRHHPLVLDLGADVALDRRDPDVVRRTSDVLARRHLAGIVAIGSASTVPTVRIAANVGARRSTESAQRVGVASVQPSPLTTLVSRLARFRGVRLSTVWGGSVAHERLGAEIFTRVLPAALAAGSYRPAPFSEVAGQGLEAVPDALERLRAGVSSRKLVVRIP